MSTTTRHNHGTKLNTTTTISSTEGGAGNSAQATLLVNDPFVGDRPQQAGLGRPDVQWFKFTSVPVGGFPVFYRFSIYNGGQVPFTAVLGRRPDSRWRAVGPCHL